MQYLDWRQKEGYNYCKVCGKEIKISKTKPMRYCGKCAKDIKEKQDLERYKNKK